MIGFLKNLLGAGPKLNIGELLARGAMTVDVRTEENLIPGM